MIETRTRKGAHAKQTNEDYQEKKNPMPIETMSEQAASI